jgi:nucleoside-diphosphate-sugar epimerase
MHNILITGGCGFIGRHLVKRLLNEETHYKISVIDNVVSNIKKNRCYQNHSNKLIGKHNLKPSSQKNKSEVSFYKADIRNKDSILEVFNDQKIDTCIHLAAKISVEDSINNPNDTIDTNVKGTLNVLDACSENNIKNFVFASSAAVYGKPKFLPISEHHVALEEVLSPYGASKIAAEALVSSYGKIKKIQKAISLRFFNVYGENQTDEYAGVITKFAMRLSKGLPPIIYGDGKQTRDFIFVADVIDAIMMAAADANKNTSSLNVFNIGTGIPIRIDDLAQKMTRIFGLELQPIYQKAKKGDVMDSYADTTKSKQILKFIAHKDFDEGLREIINSQTLKNESV